MRWTPHCLSRSRMKSATSCAISVCSLLESVASEDAEGAGGEPGESGDAESAAVEIRPELDAPRLGAVIEPAVRREVACYGVEEVVRAAVPHGLVDLLRVVAGAREV